MTDAPSLGQLIWLVRRELEWARSVDADADADLRFELGEVELQASLEVSHTRGGSGGLDLKVLGVGGQGELSREGNRGTVASVTVTLTPSDRRSPGSKYEISALDVEPPPRRAEMTAADDVPQRH